MSDSLVDRILVGHSLGGNGPLTRSLHETHTSGFIRPDAPHWSIEPYLPLTVTHLVDYLMERRELEARHEGPFRQCCDELDKLLQQQSGGYHRCFSAAYARLDPDTDQRIPAHLGIETSAPPAAPPAGSSAAAVTPAPRKLERFTEGAARGQPQVEGPELDAMVSQLITLSDEVLQLAGFRRLEIDEITRCVGVVSPFGVPLHVDLQIFQKLLVYARGDVIGTRIRRRLRKLYRREAVEVQVYQRLVVIFQLRDDDDSDEQLLASAVHLRMFKNVPKLDIDTLLPGARVRITGIDRAKIVLPSLGGFLMSLRKIAQYALLAAVIALHWSAILAGLLLGYLIKSVFSYFQTKNRYQLNLTRNLYFQKLDANAGVGHHVIRLAHQQLLMEAILAQYAILTSDEPISSRRLRRKCERLIREAVNVEVDFQADRALQTLLQIGVVQPIDENWIAEPSRFG